MNIREKTIPVLCPTGDDEDARMVGEVIKSGWWINGPKVKEFEEKICGNGWHKICNRSYK